MKEHDINTLEISVIIPVFHEYGICRLLEHLKRISAGHAIEIIVADGDADGSTIGRITDPMVRTLISPKGRAVQMNTAAAMANGSVLLFLHADTMLPANAFDLIAKVMADPKYIGGAFDLGFDAAGSVFFLTAVIGSLKHRLTRVPYGDQAIFLAREYFERLGGYSAIPLMEDVDLMKRIKRRRWKIRILPYRVRTSARKWLEEGVWHTIFRNWAIRILYLLGVSPEKLVRYYYKR